MLATALPMLAGYCAFGAGMWQATRVYRRDWVARWRSSFERVPRDRCRPRGKNAAARDCGNEFGAMFGFPGLGWLYAGQALLGVLMLCAGPAIAWALIPMLTSPFSDSALKPYGIEVLFVWLGATAVLTRVLSPCPICYVKRSLAKNPSLISLRAFLQAMGEQ